MPVANGYLQDEVRRLSVPGDAATPSSVNTFEANTHNTNNNNWQAVSQIVHPTSSSDPRMVHRRSTRLLHKDMYTKVEAVRVDVPLLRPLALLACMMDVLRCARTSDSQTNTSASDTSDVEQTPRSCPMNIHRTVVREVTVTCRRRLQQRFPDCFGTPSDRCLYCESSSVVGAQALTRGGAYTGCVHDNYGKARVKRLKLKPGQTIKLKYIDAHKIVVRKCEESTDVSTVSQLTIRLPLSLISRSTSTNVPTCPPEPRVSMPPVVSRKSAVLSRFELSDVVVDTGRSPRVIPLPQPTAPISIPNVREIEQDRLHTCSKMDEDGLSDEDISDAAFLLRHSRFEEEEKRLHLQRLRFTRLRSDTSLSSSTVETPLGSEQSRRTGRSGSES
eukprot:GILJ01003265.1.p1 GENE.GILJ01003265.1~~GILJ01003265.1.p1  ORF type:complete len:418 (+),score=42.61 GILJ01003265.1:93-1256(+)